MFSGISYQLNLAILDLHSYNLLILPVITCFLIPKKEVNQIEPNCCVSASLIPGWSCQQTQFLCGLPGLMWWETFSESDRFYPLSLTALKKINYSKSRQLFRYSDNRGAVQNKEICSRSSWNTASNAAEVQTPVHILRARQLMSSACNSSYPLRSKTNSFSILLGCDGMGLDHPKNECRNIWTAPNRANKKY